MPQALERSRDSPQALVKQMVWCFMGLIALELALDYGFGVLVLKVLWELSIVVEVIAWMTSLLKPFLGVVDLFEGFLKK